MNAADFVSSIPTFCAMKPADQIRRFCWLLAQDTDRSHFTGRDVAACYEKSEVCPPSSVSPFLASLSRQKPAFLTKRGGGYWITRSGREAVERSLPKRGSTIRVDSLLASLPGHLHANHERAYLEEALVCFRQKAFRASVVMTWNLAFDHLCQTILTNHLAAFNTQLPITFKRPKISAIRRRDDFEILKESEVIQVAKSANIISNSVRKVLDEKLARRNIAAHPSAVGISSLTAEEYIIDLVNNVVLKL